MNCLILGEVTVFFYPFYKLWRSLIGVNGFEIVTNKVSNKVSNKTENKILELMRDNPNVTIQQIMVKTALPEPG